LGAIAPQNNDIPESQLRPLTSLTDEAKREIWAQVNAEHETLTAKVAL